MDSFTSFLQSCQVKVSSNYETAITTYLNIFSIKKLEIKLKKIKKMKNSILFTLLIEMTLILLVFIDSLLFKTNSNVKTKQRQSRKSLLNTKNKSFIKDYDSTTSGYDSSISNNEIELISSTPLPQSSTSTSNNFKTFNRASQLLFEINQIKSKYSSTNFEEVSLLGRAILI
jgi:hypothetical protein